jgi:hypothetical protein
MSEKEKDIFAPPTQEELAEFNSNKDDIFAPPTQEELAEFNKPQEIPAAIENESQIFTPTWSTAYKGTTAVTEALPKAFSKAGEFAAQKIGGLSPEQTDYLKQNYKAMEASGMTPEAIQDTFKQLENSFKAKNLQATMALGEAEKLAPTPLTREVAEKAVEEALPELLTPVRIKEEPFQKKLKTTISQKQQLEVERLQNLLLEKDNLIANAKEYAQNKAEKAGDEAVKNAKTYKTPGTLELVPVDEKEIYNEAFDKALATSKKEELNLIKKLQSDKTELTKKLNEVSKKDITAETTEELIKQSETPLANKYASAKGLEPKESINETAINKMLEDITDVTSKKGREAFDFLRNLSAQGWDKNSGINSELAAKVREKLRAQLAPLGTKSDEKFKEVNKLLTELEAAEQAGFIERTTGQIDTSTLEGKISKFSPESVKIGQSEQQFIKRVMNPSTKDLQNVDIQEGRKLLDTLVADPVLLDKVKQAAIKMDLLDPTKAMKFGATDAFRFMIGAGIGQIAPIVGYEGVKALKTPTGSYQAATFGSRLAEKIPQSLKTTAKVLGPLAGVAGAAAGGYFGYQEAKEEGLPEIAAIPYAAFEAINPVPISPIQAKKAMEYSAQERSKKIAQNYQVSPEEMQKMQKRQSFIEDILPEWMTNKQYKLKADNPEEIASMAQAMQSGTDKASQEYGRVLNQIIDASPREKESILFGLNQQPAFRDIIKKLKGK